MVHPTSSGWGKADEFARGVTVRATEAMQDRGLSPSMVCGDMADRIRRGEPLTVRDLGKVSEAVGEPGVTWLL